MTRFRAFSLTAASVLALSLALPAAAQTSPGQRQGGPGAPAQTQPQAQSGMDRGSVKFVNEASMSDMFEIEAAKLAVQKSRNDAVRSFAQKMLDDHQKMSSQLKAAAGSQAAATTQLDRKHAQKLEQLRQASGAQFDRLYMETQVQGHREALKLHQDYAKGGDNTNLKKVATEAVPHVQQHLQRAEALHKQTAEVPRDRAPGDRSPAQNSGQRAPGSQPTQPQNQQRVPPAQAN